MTRSRRTFTEDFKKQIVLLYENGKPRKEIIAEYELTPSALDKWVKQSRTAGSFKEADNRTPEQTELMKIRKELKQLQMENDIFKASRADHGTKVKVIRNNRHKYSVSAMCIVLNISRSSYYYEAKIQDNQQEERIRSLIIEIFQKSRQNYGARKIKIELKKQDHRVSRRRIGRIMKEEGLISSYTLAQFKPHKAQCNEEKVGNELDRSFHQQEELAVVVSDLTYVRVKDSWNYICLLIDLYNRELIGHSVGPKKDAKLVSKALSTVQHDLRLITLFHTDRGSEFKNKHLDETLETFEIKRSLSMKGCPYDNAVAEATYKILKTEFVRGRTFETLEQLRSELYDYVHWFNHFRIHETLGYLSPVQFKETHLKKSV
ncbi:IS3 family transposase [Bacillus testis]|uniref:IS3 family transposase n=2 Tax=Bacillus testis TaxID=1622072 RepID=UPI0011CC36B9|nr:IS3 family transposase [Bacillus testis]